MTELLPCPFCGGAAELDTRQGYVYAARGQYRHGTAVAVYCRECSVQISVCREDVLDITPEAVVEMWNRRTAQEKPTAKVIDHVCGLQGYNGMIDPPCPACEASRIARESIPRNPMPIVPRKQSALDRMADNARELGLDYDAAKKGNDHE